MARVNYQREKRLKDLDRQRKQEEKRNRRLLKGETPGTGGAPVVGPEDPASPQDGPDAALEPGAAVDEG